MFFISELHVLFSNVETGEETASGRTVRVTIPPPRRSKESGGNDKYKQDAVLPSATLTDFVLETRLAIQPHVAVAAVSAVPATSSSGPARPAAAVAPMAGDSQWGGLKVWPIVAAAAAAVSPLLNMPIHSTVPA